MIRHIKTLLGAFGLMSLTLIASDANAMAGACCRPCGTTCSTPTPRPTPPAEKDCCCKAPCCRKCCPMVCPEPKPCEPCDCRCLNEFKPNEMWEEFNGVWHNPRGLNDFSPEEFKTIMLQMRMLGKMPGGHVRKIMKFVSQQ